MMTLTFFPKSLSKCFVLLLFPNLSFFGIAFKILFFKFPFKILSLVRRDLDLLKVDSSRLLLDSFRIRGISSLSITKMKLNVCNKVSTFRTTRVARFASPVLQNDFSAVGEKYILYLK